MINIRQLFSGGIELDLQTAHRKATREGKEKIAVSDIEDDLEKNVSDGVLLSRYSLKDPVEYSELASFDNIFMLETYKKSKNHLENKITGEKILCEDCTLVKYYRLANPEFIYSGLNPVESSRKMSCTIFGCDAISFSQKDSDEQTKLYKNLILVLTECLNELKIKPNNVICIPSGDGYFIIFHDIDDPLLVIEFSHAVQLKIIERTWDLPLRIGIETGTVFEVRHKNNQSNAIGHSLNSCARIMNLGKNKHILVSKTFYDAYIVRSKVKNNFHDFKEHEVKHGERIHIYNYSKDNIGNTEQI